ncbi:MAG TPA: hypothetical protein PKE51_12880, partial [Gemmatimonadaceae bacterium]|nr:hypothetical protein [Gemmatimonadaceae bacterium]
TAHHRATGIRPALGRRPATTRAIGRSTAPGLCGEGRGAHADRKRQGGQSSSTHDMVLTQMNVRGAIIRCAPLR